MTMTWRKLGQIFNPTDHVLPNGCVEFAQSPQPLVCDDFVRVYFSTRTRDATGLYLSHVAFADFDRTWKLLSVTSEPVIPLGELGCFDEHGIFPMNVVRDGTRILAYTTGWNRKKSTPNDAAIGLAVSENNGRSFKKVGQGPVLGASLHEPFLIADGMVTKVDDVFHMWYICGTRWIKHDEGKQPDRVYKIRHATSKDGVSWEREGRAIIKDVLNADECQALPSVVKGDGVWHMIFCYREAIGFRDQKAAGYRLGYACSTDLVHWDRHDKTLNFPLSESGWDSEMQSYPFAFEMDGKIHLVYNGNQFGKLGFGVAVLEHA
jgi:predicted GH43/DUF377 family glycosyl hydrolase